MPSKVNINFDKLPEFRVDPLSSQEVLIASGRSLRQEKRSNRVVAYTTQEMVEYLKTCPFCPGNEDNTPEETWSHRRDIGNLSSWMVRAFPNRFPCHTIEEPKSEGPLTFFSRYRKPGTGAHEIIVDTPAHNGWLSGLSVEQISLAFNVAVQRYFSLEGDPRFEQFYLFKNYGRDAGASLTHPHIQIVCTKRSPKKIQIMVDRSHERMMKDAECLMCRLLQEERLAGREVFTTGRFVIVVPFAARNPLEVRIVPMEHNPSFGHALRDDATRLEFAFAVKSALRRIKYILQHNSDEPANLNEIPDPPYNLMLFTAPYKANYKTNSFHWFVELVPKTTKMAGYEHGTDTIINPSVPEEDAQLLRETPSDY